MTLDEVVVETDRRAHWGQPRCIEAEHAPVEWRMLGHGFDNCLGVVHELQVGREQI